MPTKSQAQTSVKNTNTEVFSLAPNTLIILWEIDVSRIIDEYGLKSIYTEENQRVFRFHNSIKLPSSTIIWKGKNYIPIPIQAEGFEYSAKGAPTTPKLTLSVNEDGIPALGLLKSVIRSLDDLNGAKVTRHRTFAKYLDAANFFGDTPPDGFAPDVNAYFAPEIYYIDRKTGESKMGIQFELSTIFDIEGAKLPGRIVNARRCPFQYRGEGCLYEYVSNRVEFIHGTENESTLPISAPPVANDKDELIQDILGAATTINYVGEYIHGDTYSKGHAVHVQKDGIKYYFVALNNGTNQPPPNDLYWTADQCSKTMPGCRLRWGSISDGSLPFGGFPSVATVQA